LEADRKTGETHDFGLVHEELLELLVLCALPDDVLADVDLPAESVRVPETRILVRKVSTS
jgi:hypothetical protein